MSLNNGVLFLDLMKWIEQKWYLRFLPKALSPEEYRHRSLKRVGLLCVMLCAIGTVFNWSLLLSASLETGVCRCFCMSHDFCLVSGLLLYGTAYSMGWRKTRPWMLKSLGIWLCLLALSSLWALHTKLTVNLQHRIQHKSISMDIMTAVLTSVAGAGKSVSKRTRQLGPI